MLNSRKPEHPPDMYYIRRNPEMLERFLNDEHRMLRDFIQDSDEKNKRFYSIFKVSREDQRAQIEALKPPKREKSPEDPYFQKLEYKPYHVGVHQTHEVMRKLAPFESR